MIAEVVIRFFIGGAVVSSFAILGDILQPKTFAGIFAAAPSVGLGTLALAYASHGATYVSFEARSMVLGALAFIVYSVAAAWLVRRHGVSRGLELLCCGSCGLPWP